jgi:type VI secretion system secreted protein VgrG
MAKTTQKGRRLFISTPLGDDYLLINRMSVSEEISRLFTIDVDLLHEESKSVPEPTTIEAEKILGKAVTITCNQTDGGARAFSGIVTRFSQGNRNAKYSFYRATIRPHVWILTQNVQSRIFQHENVKDILAKVLADFDFSDEIQGDFKPRNFCVQYKESDWDFAQRLMEEEGIYYFFEHTGGMDKLILGNDPGSHRDCPRKYEIQLYDESQEDQPWVSSVRELNFDYRLGSGKYVTWDYHFQNPTNKYEQEHSSRFNAGENRDMEIYDFPGGSAKHYDDIDKTGKERSDIGNIYKDKENSVKSAMEALDTKVHPFSGFSDCCTFTAGHRFKLNNHPSKSLNRNYVLTAVNHEINQMPGYPGIEEVHGFCENTFTCIPHGQNAPVFRPLPSVEKPLVHGTQTALVVGPADQEIFTDKYGRIKVQFIWDRRLPFDPDSSCWVRVARDIAGNKWGTMYIPRIGQEVIVDFEHGDPDRPIVVGSVYNPDTMPHYELPKFKTLTYIKTRTSPDDGKGYNELRFEDKATKEQVFIRSQKRMDVRVRGSLYETCGGSRNEVIGLKKEDQPGGNHAVTVSGCYDLHVKESNYIGIDAKLNETVKSDVVENYQGKQYTEVTGKRELNAQEITLEALSKITMKVGGTFISLDLSGVTISGPMVKINSGGAGMGTSPADIMDPADAETSDTGEPGYLDKPRKGGGGGRKKRTLKGQHAPPFETKTLPNGDIQVGKGLIIKKSPTDPDFQKKALEDLTTMSNYPAGMDTLNSINNSGKTTSIQHKPAGGNNYTPSNTAGALPKGDKFGGTTGTGTGSDGTVGWNPDNAATNAKRPRDVGLHHELSHADHASNGQYDITHNDPSQPKNPHKEESNTIDRDNEYRKQRGVHTRKDHTEL